MCNIKRFYVLDILFKFKDSICSISVSEQTENGIPNFFT